MHRRKIRILLIVLLAQITIVTFAAFYMTRASVFERTLPITLSGKVRQGMQASRPLTIIYISVSVDNENEQIYYVLDKTSEHSRRQKATHRCSSGTIDCFVGYSVYIDGYVVSRIFGESRQKVWATMGTDRHIAPFSAIAQELHVGKFEVL
jgi:hypothetical protein